MAQAVTRYKADDGSLWDTEAQADKRSNLVMEVRAAMRHLPDVDVERHQYFQHDPIVLFTARRELYEIAKREHLQSFPKLLAANADEVHPLSFVGRVLSECDGPVPRAWNRFCRICFDTFREYDQPYRVRHPEEAVECINA